MTLPLTFLAARPIVWMRLRSSRKKPSLSASRMNIVATSGMSKPFAKKVNANKDVEFADPQLPYEFDPV